MSKTVPQSKAGSSQAGETDILYTAQGKLSLKDAFSYDVPKIIAFMEQIAADPPSHGVEAKYITPSHGIVAVANRVILFAKQGVNFDVVNTGKDAHGAVAHNDVITPMFDNEKVLLPTSTAFDMLGWVMSVTAKASVDPKGSPGENPNALNFYLPLLALYANWCRKLAFAEPGGTGKEIPRMVHLAYTGPHADFGPNATSRSHLSVLIGATVGENDYRGNNIIRVRQDRMLQAGLQPASESQLNIGTRPPADPTTHVPEANQGDESGENGFGKCAETFFHIFAKITGILQANVRGFALNTKKLDDSPYNEQKILAVLTAPCGESCIPLMQGMKLDPVICFGVARDRVTGGFDYKERTKQQPKAKP